AYRGAGRPEATYLVERIVDQAARLTGIDRAEIRRRNFIPRDAFPYQTPVVVQYDSGDYQSTLEIALKEADYDGFETRRKASADKGKLRGIGISTYIEACGIAPSAVVGSVGARAGLYESAAVRVNPTGSVSVFTGSHSHGQGHETTFAQLVSEQLGVPFDQIEIVHGDTNRIPFGMGTYGSRSLAVGGSALVKAMDKVIEKGKKIAAHIMEAAVEDIEFKDGSFTVAGTDKAMALAEISGAAYVPHNYPITELEPGLEEQAFYDPLNFTFPGGCHICEVEIDRDTGVVDIASFVAVDDVGRVINPMIVEGQVQGGIAQGIGQALYEACVYDSDGQLVTGSYNDYNMPKADLIPNMRVQTHNTLCTHNPLGVKGVGEVGAIGSPPAVMNAVLDALAPLGIHHMDMPATPQKVWAAINGAGMPQAAE
ncbi:MAG: molybdopterin-dependent oxidoreductase, partial [Rhodospirillaceae bacterium]|nr:molybdopterin-dependent oxidoreductase [Rhodospirillaceae bacterium]